MQDLFTMIMLVDMQGTSVSDLKEGIAEIEKELGRLAKAARDGSLSMADMQGGTFTITNGGVTIINPN